MKHEVTALKELFEERRKVIEELRLGSHSTDETVDSRAGLEMVDGDYLGMMPEVFLLSQLSSHTSLNMLMKKTKNRFLRRIADRSTNWKAFGRWMTITHEAEERIREDLNVGRPRTPEPTRLGLLHSTRHSLTSPLRALPLQRTKTFWSRVRGVKGGYWGIFLGRVFLGFGPRVCGMLG